ncbi:MAG: OmpA family protein [Rhodospirillaceae bacterium]|nr:MAG: OmpA family protein [Rhodospirillaceae bacterium]
MKLLRTSLFAAAFALGTTAAMAADPAASGITPPGAGPYIGLGAGMTSIDSSPLQVNGVPSILKFKDGWGVVGSAGYKWEQGFRTELELSHRDNKAKDLNANNTPVTGSQQDTSVMANVLLDIPTGSRLTPYLGAGIGVSWVNFDQVHSAASPIYDGTSGKFAWQYIAGVAYTIAPNWELTGEFRYKGSNGHAYPGSVAGNQVTHYNDRARDILIGVRYSFGAPPAAPAPAAPMPAPMATAPTPPPAPPVPEKFLVFFDLDKSNLRADAKKIVAQAAEYSKTNGKTTITATGHADTSGSAAYNMALSERRAQAVQKALEQLGIPASEIVVRWKGESEPLVQTGDGVKEPQNRRVEIVLE